MEDGLLVSHHLSVSDCQGVVAALQVKILKCQFDYLDSRWSITTVTISDRCWNVSDARCRGEPSVHLWPSTAVHTRLSCCLKKIILIKIPIFLGGNEPQKSYRKRLKINTHFCLSCQMRILFVKSINMVSCFELVAPDFCQKDKVFRAVSRPDLMKKLI